MSAMLRSHNSRVQPTVMLQWISFNMVRVTSMRARKRPRTWVFAEYIYYFLNVYGVIESFPSRPQNNLHSVSYTVPTSGPIQQPYPLAVPITRHVNTSTNLSDGTPKSPLPSTTFNSHSCLILRERTKHIVSRVQRWYLAEFYSRTSFKNHWSAHQQVAWNELLLFAPVILAKPEGGGARRNLRNIINKWTAEWNKANPIDSTPVTSWNKLARWAKDDDKHLAAAIRSKLEAGNFKAAVRLLCDDDRPASSNDVALQALRDKHPGPAPHRRRPIDSTSITRFTSLQFSQKDSCWFIGMIWRPHSSMYSRPYPLAGVPKEDFSTLSQGLSISCSRASSMRKSTQLSSVVVF